MGNLQQGAFCDSLEFQIWFLDQSNDCQAQNAFWIQILSNVLAFS